MQRRKSGRIFKFCWENLPSNILMWIIRAGYKWMKARTGKAEGLEGGDIIKELEEC
jgi:hypothetical protein